MQGSSCLVSRRLRIKMKSYVSCSVQENIKLSLYLESTSHFLDTTALTIVVLILHPSLRNSVYQEWKRQKKMF